MRRIISLVRQTYFVNRKKKMGAEYSLHDRRVEFLKKQVQVEDPQKKNEADIEKKFADVLDNALITRGTENLDFLREKNIVCNSKYCVDFNRFFKLLRDPKYNDVNFKMGNENFEKKVCLTLFFEK